METGMNGGLSLEYIEKQLQTVENIFLKLGASELEINEKNRQKFGQRKIFKYNGKYYRADCLHFDENDKVYISLSCTDDEQYANVGLLDDVDAFEIDLSEQSIENKIREMFEGR